MGFNYCRDVINRVSTIELLIQKQIIHRQLSHGFHAVFQISFIGKKVRRMVGWCRGWIFRHTVKEIQSRGMVREKWKILCTGYKRTYYNILIPIHLSLIHI